MKSSLHAMAIIHCKSMAILGSKGQECSRNMANLIEQLDPQEHREFRSGAGICQNMTGQRFEFSFSTKEIMREAAGPTTASRTKLKRLARYFKGRKRCVLNFFWLGKVDDVIHVTVDVWWSVGSRSVHHSSTLICDTGNSIAIFSRVRGQGDHEGLHGSVARETFAGTPYGTTVQN